MLKDKSMSLEPSSYNFRNNIEFLRNKPFILDLGINILGIKSMIYINYMNLKNIQLIFFLLFNLNDSALTSVPRGGMGERKMPSSPYPFHL